MARIHGSSCRVYLGGRDASGDLSEVSPKGTAKATETTNLASGGWMEYEPAILSWECGFSGFYDPAVGGFGQQMEDIGGSPVLSIYDGDANAVGDTGILFGAGILSSTDKPMNVADVVKVTGSIVGSGRAGWFGKLLHPHGQETISANGTSLDNAASSANGGRANLHVTAITGTWTVKIQHSANNTDWADLVTFTQATAAIGITAESKEVTGTVNRYLRAICTEDVAGSITFACGFARY